MQRVLFIRAQRHLILSKTIHLNITTNLVSSSSVRRSNSNTKRNIFTHSSSSQEQKELTNTNTNTNTNTKMVSNKTLEKRTQLINDQPLIKGDKKPVVYWMSRDQRVKDNWALLYAIELANEEKKPVIVCFNVVTKFLGAGARQFGFMLRGLEEVERDLRERNIPFKLLINANVEAEPKENIEKFCKEIDAACVITDFSPLRLGLKWRNDFAKETKRSVRVVDAHNVVPCWIASPKLEVGARTLRGKLAKLYGEFLIPFPNDLPKIENEAEQSALFSEMQQNNKNDFQSVLKQALERGKDVPEVTWAVPGEKAAMSVLDNFLKKRMNLYGLRNDPAKPQALSGLSPYLHFGQISGQRCAMMALAAKTSSNGKAVDVFFEELVVRRELADNFCYYSPNYDTLDGQVYDWAKDTLQAHAGDKREYVYTYDEFEKAKTHDDLWNAAQRELVYGGKMHGFMRMYWAKKILEWSDTPENALKYAITLNDRWSLDGRDPSGYVGCMWSIVGVHDQGWKEREIFGKIRYMAYSGCEKKFKIPQYIQRVDELVDAVKRNETSYKSNPGKFEIGRDDLLPKAVPEKEDKEENQKPLKKQKHEKKK
jgi:deoxyribodipyrimidine photo-lyase